MSARQILRLSNIKTASRCWIPATASPSSRYFSSKQRAINFNLHSLSDANLISNDDVLINEYNTSHTQIEVPDETFHPTVYSAEEVHTPGPVNKQN